jgi:hypothetical protein
MKIVATSVGAIAPTFWIQKRCGVGTTVATVQIATAMPRATLPACHHALHGTTVAEITAIPTRIRSGVVGSFASTPSVPVAMMVTAYAENPTTRLKVARAGSRRRSSAAPTTSRLIACTTLTSRRSPGCMTIQPTKTTSTPARMKRRQSRALSRSSRSLRAIASSAGELGSVASRLCERDMEALLAPTISGAMDASQIATFLRRFRVRFARVSPNAIKHGLPTGRKLVPGA